MMNSSDPEKVAIAERELDVKLPIPPGNLDKRIKETSAAALGIAGTLEAAEKPLFLRGYSRGLSQMFEDTGELRGETTATNAYIFLLFFADVVDRLRTRTEVIKLMRASMGKSLPQEDETLIKLFGRIKLKSRE